MNWDLKKQRNIMIGLSVILLIALVPLGIFYVHNDLQAVASVNGQDINKKELYDLMLKQNGQNALDALIAQKIVEIEANKQNITVSEEETQKELEKYYEYYGGQEGFVQMLSSSGFTLDDVKKDTQVTLKIKKLMEPRIEITEDELKSYFEENKDTFAQEKQVKASHILVDTEEKANELKQKLNNGEDFAQLAKENSTDTSTSQEGGELGFFSQGQMVDEFENAAFALPVGEVSNPVKTEYGYHLIKVEEIKEAREPDYETSKEEIRDTLFDQKVSSEYETWLQEMYQQYQIDNYLAK